MSDPRLVAVFGYSTRRTPELHPICAARLERAVSETSPGDAVLLSGWARRRRSKADEAELMRCAWRGTAGRIVLDRSARTTYGNAVGAAATARELDISEVVLVTSGWHGRRASSLLRAALSGSGRRVTIAATPERGTIRARLRELGCWPIVPLLAVLAARTGSSR